MAQSKELIEYEEEKRYTMFPIKRWPEWRCYKKAQELFWVEEEIDTELAKNPHEWNGLDRKIRRFLKRILAFFAVSDGIVAETIVEDIINRIQVKEIKLWYNFQIMMEDIHNIVYSKLIDTYIQKEHKKQKLFNAIENYPTIRHKAEWAQKWSGRNNEINKLSNKNKKALQELEKIYRAVKELQKTLQADDQMEASEIDSLFIDLHEPRQSLARQVLINTIMEGVFFSGSFCAIYWIYNNGGKLPGLSKANEFISRDEGMHTDFGVHIYWTCINRLEQIEVHEIMKEAVDVEAEFICDALPVGLLGMNAELMTTYVQFVADQLLIRLGYDKVFNSENPFPFMDKQSTSVRIGDFFTDGNISEYGHHSADTTINDQMLNFSEEFA
jgi:ribonucleotide reductase beta subunit family protein with ferritin-like domain